jgi:ferrochelatase
MDWIESCHNHPCFVAAWKEQIEHYLIEKGLREDEVLLLFSAHSLPQKIIAAGDPYAQQCQESFEMISRAFPKAQSRLSFQSKVGWGRWLEPSMANTCRKILNTSDGRKHVVVIPLSFTSDHIETLYEIEHKYLPLLSQNGLKAHRCPAFGSATAWGEAIWSIIKERLL